MKKTYKFYPIGTKVWAISRRFENNKPTSEIQILPAIVCGFGVDYDEKNYSEIISYLLNTPTGDMWGDSVNEDEVNEDFNILMEKMKKEWEKEANTF